MINVELFLLFFPSNLFAQRMAAAELTPASSSEISKTRSTQRPKVSSYFCVCGRTSTKFAPSTVPTGRSLRPTLNSSMFSNENACSRNLRKNRLQDRPASWRSPCSKTNELYIARPGAAGLLFQLTLGRHLSLQKKKTKTIIIQHAVTGVHNLLCVKAAAVTTL